MAGVSSFDVGNGPAKATGKGSEAVSGVDDE